MKRVKTRHDTSGSDRAKKLAEEQGKLRGQFGWFESAKYPDGKPVALVAAEQEYGSAANGVRPHPFFRQSIAENRDRWRQVAAKLLKSALEGNSDAKQVFGTLANIAEADVRKSIASLGNYAVDGPVVRARRGRTKPPPTQSTAILKDTTQMISTLTSAVTPK